MNKDSIKKINNKIYKAVFALNLPVGHYAITSSGPMGIRGLRIINDADLIVDNELWDELSVKYPPVEEGGITKIVLSEGLIEILGSGSFFCNYDEEDPTVDEQISTAEVIDGLSFVRLEHIRYFKERLGREKDKRDIELINKELNQKQ